MALLAARALSAHELRLKLVRKGIETVFAERAVERLIEQGLLDDSQYAHARARSALTGRGLSARRVEGDLRRRGVAPALAATAVSDVIDEESVDLAAAAEKVARRKARTFGDLDEPTKRRRLYGFLARRGYSPDEIRTAMAAALGASDDVAGHEALADDNDGADRESPIA